MNGDQKIRVGSRKSELALIQTRHVISLLKKQHPEKEFEIVTMSTLGDKILDIPLPKIGEKSLFTKELEAALATGCVDFVVHSLKDLPTSLPLGMAIGAVLAREDPRDALVLQKDHDTCCLETLPHGSIIGTSSLRRTAQLAKKYPHLKVENIRGNLNTRLRKLDELGQFQGIILAAAGLTRMGWTNRITKILDSDELLYAVGQGAIAVECRENDERTINLLKPLYDVETALRVITERSFLKTLGGGCSAPVAVVSELINKNDRVFSLKLKGAVWSLDGKEEIMEDDECEVEIKDGKRCATCPYGFQVENADCLRDIENLRNCNNNPCSVSPTKEVPAKRQKIAEVPAELLKNDPHEQCPIQLPIGVDFMGQCPYLESNLVKIHGKFPVNTTIEASNAMQKCPFFKDGKLQNIPNLFIDVPSNSTSTEPSVKCPYRENRNYCGLVPHDRATIVSLEEAQDLGVKLAQNLMKQGASEVMSKAQAIIHGSIGVTN